MDEGLVPAIRLKYLQVRNFRCFEQFEVHITSPYLIFSGANGVGKTSLLEALYYGCYLRSFRTHIPKELINFGKPEFFIKMAIDSAQELSHTIHIGFSPHKRLVKIDQKAITSYKELMTYYRIVSVTEHDLALVQGSPQDRRLFLDHVILLLDPNYGTILKEYRHLVDQRNALLQQRSFSKDTYLVLTELLWKRSLIMQQQREIILKRLTEGINKQRETLFAELAPIECHYVPKKALGKSYEEFWDTNKNIMEQEGRFGRSLFGAHLDDIQIIFQGQSSRLFASRGQQKLIVMLIKIAQLELLHARGIPAICVLDDFMTDFDGDRMIRVVAALNSLDTQLIFTTPLEQNPLTVILMAKGAQMVKLTI